jgi:hypothetical protein
MDAVPAAPAGIQRLTALTRGDGTYEMLADAPGQHWVELSMADGRGRLRPRSLDLPDADAYTFDIAIPASTVSGIVVDAKDGRPLRGTVGATPTERQAGVFGTPGSSGADGRFVLDLDPGDYTISASAEGYARATTEATVTESGLSDVRLALARGLAISGKVLDGRGRGVGGLFVLMTSRAGSNRLPGAPARTLPDGSFSIEGLEEGEHTLSAGDELSGYAFAAGVAAGTTGVVLRLVPGGRVVATVLMPDGTPGRGLVFVSTVDGIAAGPMVGRGTTNDRGVAELAVPAGRLELKVSGPGGGSATVTVGSGETVPLEIRLEPVKPPAPETR